jgi:ubiquinone/menaquinone biosynthesis C-methylase UbiE
MRLKGNEALLDVATGTGHVAVRAAQRLTDGRVTGIDISDKMLQKARAKADGLNLRNITFKCCDIEDMGFVDVSFDTASCSFGIFFLPDMENGLRCISKVLKPVGRIFLTSFTPGLMQPLRGMLVDRLNGYGIEESHFSARVDTAEKIEALLKSADLKDIHIQSRQVGYYLNDESQWREILLNTAYRNLLAKLPDGELEPFMEAHLREIAQTANENGIWLEVEVLFADAGI